MNSRAKLLLRPSADPLGLFVTTWNEDRLDDTIYTELNYSVKAP